MSTFDARQELQSILNSGVGDAEMKSAIANLAVKLFGIQGKQEELGIRGAQEAAKRQDVAQNAQALEELRAQNRINAERERFSIKKDMSDYEQRQQTVQLQQRSALRNRLEKEGMTIAGDPRKAKTLAAIMGQLEKLDDVQGPVAAQRLADRDEVQYRVRAIKRLSYYEPKFRAIGAEAPSMEEAISLEKTSPNPAQEFDKKLNTAGKTFYQEAETVEHTKLVNETADKIGIKGPKRTAFVEAAGGMVNLTKKDKLAQVTEDYVSGKRKASGLKGLAAAGVLAYLGSKWLGSKDEEGQRIDPQMQMMLMQKMAQAQQGGGGEDGGQGAGRELMNMSRALNIIKMMSQMQGMQSGGPVDVARLM